MANDPHDNAHDEHEPPLPTPHGAMPPIDMTTFFLSLSASALVHMGLAPAPDGSASPPDLALARQNIDILLLLQEKTRGNLTGGEERLLHQILFDLRMRFIDVAKRAGGAPTTP
ncbi:MAG: DUF1844 domain-containing protein [Polyangiales bacterium]